MFTDNTHKSHTQNKQTIKQVHMIKQQSVFVFSRVHLPTWSCTKALLGTCTFCLTTHMFTTNMHKFETIFTNDEDENLHNYKKDVKILTFYKNLHIAFLDNKSGFPGKTPFPNSTTQGQHLTNHVAWNSHGESDFISRCVKQVRFLLIRGNLGEIVLL